LEAPRGNDEHTPENKDAAIGERMIEVKIRFWTNDLADGAGRVRPRHAWASGVVRMDPNATHGVTPGSPAPFHSLLDLGSVIEKVLIAHGITLHPGRRMKKYFSAEPATAASTVGRKRRSPR
jgi:hypothetical protein